MSAKIEGGSGWSYNMIRNGMQAEGRLNQLRQPINMGGKNNVEALSLYFEDKAVSFQLSGFYTQISIHRTELRPALTKAQGLVMRWSPKLSELEAEDGVWLEEYVLSGPLAVVRFGQKADPGYLKVTHQLDEGIRAVSI